MENFETLYRLEEVRTILKVSDATVRRYVRSGKIRYQKLGREYRITESAIKEFLDAQNPPKEG